MIFGPPPPQPTGYLDLVKEENRHQEAMQCAAYRQMIAELKVRIAELERENVRRGQRLEAEEKAKGSSAGTWFGTILALLGLCGLAFLFVSAIALVLKVLGWIWGW